MTTLPIKLPPGYMLVYGEFTDSFSGIVPSNQNMRFGTVYQIWDGGQTYVYGGDQIMYDKNKVEVRIAANSTDPFQYQMIEARLVTKDIPIP